MLRVAHLCQFHFASQDIRVVGSETDGGTSLSGISQPIETSGGGYWQGDFNEGNFGGRQDSRRSATLEWRSLNAELTGGGRVVVEFCDRHHQPILGFTRPPFPMDSSGEDASPGSVATVTAVVNGQTAGLNATIIDITIASERPLLGGERFTHVHATWLDRAYQINTATPITGGYRLTFIPPIRGGIAIGDALDFNKPRCVMRRASAPSNAIAQGLFSNASITFVEDMRPPAP